MTCSRWIYDQLPVYFALFASFALAALQNVTVDDAVLTGAVVPQYLPNNSEWNIGNTCTECFVQPDSSLAYNGTWHDATYSPNNNYTQAIQFTFTGSALYIFFIIANNVPSATTFTDVDFVLDNIVVGRYTHTPSTSANYQYNVAVYVNESLASGEHNMTIQPYNSGGNVLILFDYLIYSVDTSASISPFATATSALPPSATSSGTQGTSSGQNTSAIVGGAVGGVAALVLVTATLLCYRRYKRRDGDRAAAGRLMVEPFISSREVAPTSLVAAWTTYPIRPPPAEPALRRKQNASIATLPLSILPPTTTIASSFSAPSSNNPALLEQVELLRNEVARLRDLHVPNWNTDGSLSEAPPKYS